MPALVNIRVGSSLITMGADGTMWCPFDSKKFLNESLISFAVNIFFYISIVEVNILKKLCKDSLFLRHGKRLFQYIVRGGNTDVSSEVSH